MFAGSVSWDAENIGVVVTTWLVYFAGIAAKGSANAFVAVGLHAHALAGATDEHAKMAFGVITKNGLGDLASVIVEIVVAVILDGAKIREGYFAASKPIDNLTF